MTEWQRNIGLFISLISLIIMISLIGIGLLLNNKPIHITGIFFIFGVVLGAIISTTG